MISFLHAADLHLGLRITCFDAEITKRVREARFRAIDQMMNVARERRVDFVLVAGDLFDDQAVDQVTARRAHSILNEAPMPVYVLPGNHDPLLPGSVWDRSPWSDAGTQNVRLLRIAEPVAVATNVVLLPCPVLRKTSMLDPTAWIVDADPPRDSVRIGVAHGSLKIREDLPPDDHLIARHAARDLKLDYLALGHWHRQLSFADERGVYRTAYPGVHEPMRFPGASDDWIGWRAYAPGADREEFRDNGRGEVLHVHIAGPGAAPELEPIQVQYLTWQEEAWQLTSEELLSNLIKDVAARPVPANRLLRLTLTGVLDAATMFRVEELKQILEGSYLLGQIDDRGLHLQPTEEEIQAVAGAGVLRRVLDQARLQTQDADPRKQAVAERALRLLYQVAQEVKS